MAISELPLTQPGETADPKPVVMCGDFNVAHQEIDLKNPGPNRGKAGFSDEERGKFTDLLEVGFVNSFRHLHPDVTGAYTWWSYRFKARKTNAGWRIDYFIVSDRVAPRRYKAPHPRRGLRQRPLPRGAGAGAVGSLAARMLRLGR